MATAVQEWMVKTMSDIMAMKYEDWLRGCVHHDGRKGNVYLPCDTVLEIADWIEAHKDAVPVVRCKDCKYYDTPKNFKKPYCMRGAYVKVNADDYCSKGERR